MVGKRDATPRGDMPADELFEDDGVDSRTAFSRITRRDSGDDRKARQAARVARRAIEFALANEENQKCLKYGIRSCKHFLGVSVSRAV